MSPDSKPSAKTTAPGRYEVRTRFGNAREVGTQFAVRVGAGLEVSVREGRVRLERDGTAWEARAGEELSWTDAGGLERRRIAVYGEPWEWILDTAPPFALAGRSLGEILAWTARETGWTVRYADPTLRRTYNDDVLNGDLGDLRPDLVPELVLPAFGLAGEAAGGVLTVEEIR